MKISPGTAAVVIGFIILTAVGADLGARDKFSYDGQIRLRNEYDLKSVQSRRHPRVFHDLRTRVGLKFEPTGKTMVYVQIQDSRRLGDPSSGDLTSTDNVDLHQVYFEIRDALFSGVRIKGGRFELNYGNQRVFGSEGWSNVGRSWEGVLASYRPGDIRVDFFYLKRIEMNDEDYNRDFDIYGLYGMIEPIHLDLFWFYELNSDTFGYVQEILKRHNVGLYYENSYEDFDWIIQGNYQFGERPYAMTPLNRIQNISAYMINSEAGYSFYGRLPGRIVAGVDYTSGDVLLKRHTYTEYSGLYYTSHKFLGYMDLFPYSAYGVFDKSLGLRLDPSRRWSARVDWHHFSAPKMVRDQNPCNVGLEDLGTEIDLTAEHKAVKGVVVTGGFSVFFPKPAYSYYTGGRSEGYWAYLMMTVNF